MAITKLSPLTIALQGTAIEGRYKPSTSTSSGCKDKASIARFIANKVARWILRRSISSASARP